MRAIAHLWWTLVRFGFRLLYYELAFTYDAVSYVVSLGEWRAWQRAALGYVPLPSARVLELAHGTGNLQLDMLAMGINPVGYDLSPSMGRIAARKLKQKGYTGKLVRGTAEKLPFVNEGFDVVISTFPTSFIVAENTLREVHRVLAAGGRLVIVPNGVLTGGGFLRVILEFLYQVTGQREDQSLDVISYFSQYGYKVELVQAKCLRSRVQVILAYKL